MVLLYHPVNIFLRILNLSLGKALVTMSTICSFVSIGQIFIVPSETLLLKWWYLIPICFVLERNFGHFAYSTHPLLSSKTVHLTFLFFKFSSMSSAKCVSSNNLIKVSASLIECESTTWSASVVLRAISVWSMDIQKSGHPMHLNTKPVLDKAKAEYSECNLFQSPEKDASAHTCNPLVRSGVKSVLWKLLKSLFNLEFPCEYR